MAAFSPLLDVLAEVPDPRRAEGKLNQLPHVLLFSILAIVTGSNSYRGIVTFIDVHRHRLNAAFGLKWRRAPAHTAIRYILQGLDLAAVEEPSAATPPCSRRRGDAGQGSIAWMARRYAAASTRSMSPPPRCSARSPPTPPSCSPTSTSPRSPTRSRQPRRCSPNSVSPTVPSSRWMHYTAKKTLRGRRAGNIALIVQIKDNQPTLHHQSHDISATTPPLGSAHNHNHGRNRDESRIVTIFDPADRLADTDWDPHVEAIIRVERKSSPAMPHRVCIIPPRPPTSLEPAAHRHGAADAIRAHWSVENTSHYSRDVTMGEDRSRIRSNPGMFARIRSFAFNILKSNRSDTLTRTATARHSRHRQSALTHHHSKALNSPGVVLRHGTPPVEMLLM